MASHRHFTALRRWYQSHDERRRLLPLAPRGGRLLRAAKAHVVRYGADNGAGLFCSSTGNFTDFLCGLADAEFKRLIDASRHFMRRAYETDSFKQVFLPPTLQQATGKLGSVYRRSGQPCLRCGGIIQMIRQGPMERMTFFCPFCQPLDPSHPLQREEGTPMQTPWTNTVKSLEQARDFVLEVGLCGILHDAKGTLPTLWDAVDAPDKRPGEGGWGDKMGKVWNWKNELPATYPDQIFYGKIKGGRAVLMSMNVLQRRHSQQHKPLVECSPLAQELFAVIEQGPIMTVPLRQLVGMTDRKARTQFDRALQELQITFNIARSNRPDVEGDTWVPFLEQYSEFAGQRMTS